MRLLPRKPIGWCALALLTVAGPYPLWDRILNDLDSNPVQRAVLTTTLIAGSLIVGGLALFSKRDNSALLALAFAVVLVEVLFGELLVALVVLVRALMQ